MRLQRPATPQSSRAGLGVRPWVVWRGIPNGRVWARSRQNDRDRPCLRPTPVWHCGGWGAKEAWQSTRRKLVRGRSGLGAIERREGWGTNLGKLPIGKIGLPPASDRRTVQTAPGPARSLVWGPALAHGSNCPATYAARCGTETVSTTLKGVGAKKIGLRHPYNYVLFGRRRGPEWYLGFVRDQQVAGLSVLKRPALELGHRHPAAMIEWVTASSNGGTAGPNWALPYPDRTNNHTWVFLMMGDSRNGVSNSFGAESLQSCRGFYLWIGCAGCGDLWTPFLEYRAEWMGRLGV